MSAAHVLVVDDEREIRELVKEILEDEGYEVTVADCGESARRARRDRRPDLVLLDIWMPDIDGITLLKEWSIEGGPESPVIMISGHGTVETAVEATRLGAYDFLEKPLSLAKLLLTVKRALEADRLLKENVGLRRYAQPILAPLGKSAAMERLIDQVKRIAHHDAWVLISGEPGSGKKTIAHHIHACSPRRDGPFIVVGVATMAGENAAMELFGREQGEKITYGRLEQANGGTLYLDEVGDMEEAIQAKLLSTLESRSFMRVGGSEPVELDVRIIAGTHRDLTAEVQKKRFRGDLYYQLNVVPLYIPALRDHPKDINELLDFYLNQSVQQDNLSYRKFTVAAQNRLRNYAWPGNIRELRNLVQRLLILGTEPDIDVEEVDKALGVEPQESTTPLPSFAFGPPLREARERFERAYLEHHLSENGGSVGKVAKLAGMERTHLYRKMRALGIEPKRPRRESERQELGGHRPSE